MLAHLTFGYLKRCSQGEISAFGEEVLIGRQVILPVLVEVTACCIYHLAASRSVYKTSSVNNESELGISDGLVLEIMPRQV